MPALGRGWTVSLECKTDQAEGLAVLAIHATLTHYGPYQSLRIGPFQTLAEAVERARRMTH